MRSLKEINAFLSSIDSDLESHFDELVKDGHISLMPDNSLEFDENAFEDVSGIPCIYVDQRHTDNLKVHVYAISKDGLHTVDAEYGSTVEVLPFCMASSVQERFHVLDSFSERITFESTPDPKIGVVTDGHFFPIPFEIILEAIQGHYAFEENLEKLDAESKEYINQLLE